MMATLSTMTERVFSRIEDAAFLDGPADVIGSWGSAVFRPGWFKDALSGTGTGHPLHPALVVLPLGSWAGAVYLDLRGDPSDGAAARRLLAVGNLAALPAALTGASDWVDTQGAERRVGLVHAALNYTALALMAASWLARRRGRHGTGTWTALAGLGTVTASASLGGHLAHARGVGVDTTAFQVAPGDWVDVAAVEEVGSTEPIGVDAGGVPVLLIRHDGRLRALADRCTHRGGPLHEGQVTDGCVTCPWHHSRFRLSDGAIVQGPATRPQLVYEVRTVEGRVQVRRPDEPGSLRKNPVTARSLRS